MRQIAVGDMVIGGGAPLVLIAGPCVIEDGVKTENIARYLKDLASELKIPLIFKASYDKANRSSIHSFRGPGIREGLDILRGIKEKFSVPVLSDVHRFEEIEDASKVLDIIQIPAFLCRQTDFVMEIARVAGIVNVKKGQFIAPWDVLNIIDKIVSSGNKNILITERGTCFGYNNLVADMRSLPIMREMGYPVVFDATHSVQLPGGAGDSSGGNREMAVYLARAAVATGVDGVFLEVHPDPECARCDGPNSLYLDSLPNLLEMLKTIDGIVKTVKD
ncbi:MAG TPA: 3-deoxy-8-phosphooctulonate synthase [Syntrophales bacterium]|nr:3-deoxy-8-phosphooctulonate synthase [Syntrophales bacterium]HPQ44974.1 3-deoxy-8-phosphooctulonate synthase [Syntrophales bacterium]